MREQEGVPPGEAQDFPCHVPDHNAESHEQPQRSEAGWSLLSGDDGALSPPGWNARPPSGCERGFLVARAVLGLVCAPDLSELCQAGAEPVGGRLWLQPNAAADAERRELPGRDQPVEGLRG